jgi:hypothetical protein
VEVEWFNMLLGKYLGFKKQKLGEWTGFCKPDEIDSPFSLVILQVVE